MTSLSKHIIVYAMHESENPGEYSLGLLNNIHCVQNCKYQKKFRKKKIERNSEEI